VPRRPALITQADLARAIRAAKQAGADAVEIRPDGTIVIAVGPSSSPKKEDGSVDHQGEIVL
jgi:hypothetical protein